MPRGVEDIQIEDINPFIERGFAYGTVNFLWDDTLENAGPVTHRLSAKVRVSLREGTTIEDMQEALMGKAVEHLRRVLAVVEGKSARQLISAAAEKAENERNEPFSLDLGDPA